MLRVLGTLLAVLFLLGATSIAEAQRGGRYGGRGFGGGGGYHGGGYSGGRYGYRHGGPVYRYGGPGYRYGYGGPFYGSRFHFYGGPVVWGVPAPIFGVGSLIVVMAIVALVAARAARRRRYAAGEYEVVDDDLAWEPAARTARQPVQVAKVQLALLITARHVRDELDRLARSGDTSSPTGLARLLNETAIALVREQPYWHAGFIGQETYNDTGQAERRFEEAVNGERARLDGEAVRNVGGQLEEPAATRPTGNDQKVGRYLLVTLLAAIEGPNLEDRHQPTMADLRTALLRLASVPGSQLLGLEVIWVPADPDGALDEDDLFTRYPNLSTL